MTAKFRVGDRLNIGITATVADVHNNGDLIVEYPTQLGTYETPVGVDSDAVEIEHLPPDDIRHGDLWRDVDGDLWLAQHNGTSETVNFYSVLGRETPADLASKHGPLRLVRREETNEDGGESL